MKTEQKLKIYELRQDIGELQREIRMRDSEIRKLKRAIRDDFLTKTLNRKGIVDELKGMIEMHGRNGGNFTGVIFDIDDFKSVNKLGFVIGDKLLKYLARFVSKTLRKTDKFGRLGGDEFLIILPDTTARNAEKLIEKIRIGIQRHQFIFKEAKIKVTISGGISEFKGNYDDPIEMLRRTDNGLRLSKESGKNRFNVFLET